MAAPIIKDGLSPDQLKAVLRYDPEAGTFTWLVDPKHGKKTKGLIAGCYDQYHGYVLIKVKPRLYKAHRLAWLYMTGEWPNGFVDHIDGDGFNNAWSNLREATPSENNINRSAPASNTSGFKGASWSVKSQKWLAHISFGGKAYHLGFYATPEEAHAAYKGAAVLAHGAFARTT